MKRSIWILSFALLLLGGMNTLSAQDLKRSQDRPEVVAKAKVSELSQTLDLTGDQQRTIFRAMVKYEKARSQEENYDLEAVMKKTLTAEQFDQWKKMKDN
ncbi:hypothetical protein [Aureitalea marina]|uniref:DUF4168 domain-containing protein n=1 Tax=Aureitalea marina TaxID=930804 RepID=A0A2S7KQW9_9FLAO|nr:hypothetical protein [Aureitalea marina]PQB05016.1 hypothetical protein BST85_09015 [Aureitalea marina]